MTRVCDIEKMLYDWAPRDLALEWDNVGLLVGDSGAEVRKVLVSLDVTEAVAAEAVAIGADLIVAHHPLMNCAWHKVQHVTTDDAQGRTMCRSSWCGRASRPSACIPIWTRQRAASTTLWRKNWAFRPQNP